MKSILDRSFKYTPSHATDLRKTFERLRLQQEASKSAEAKAVTSKVLTLSQVRKGAQTA